jgi:hypothetical protein
MVSAGDSPILVDLTPDLRILAFTAAISLLMGFYLGSLPRFAPRTSILRLR